MRIEKDQLISIILDSDYVTLNGEEFKFDFYHDFLSGGEGSEQCLFLKQNGIIKYYFSVSALTNAEFVGDTFVKVQKDVLCFYKTINVAREYFLRENKKG